MNARGRESWFASLRRDGRLFAAVAVALLALHAVQPLAAAARDAGEFVICTSMGAHEAPSGSAVRHENCRDCIAGHCGIALPPADLTRHADWWRLPSSTGLALPRTAEMAQRPRAAGPPSGIRAPPSQA